MDPRFLTKRKEESAKAGLQLNTKKTKVTITEELYNFNVDNKTIERLRFLHISVNCIPEIRRLGYGRAAMMEREKIIKFKHVSLESKA